MNFIINDFNVVSLVSFLSSFFLVTLLIPKISQIVHHHDLIQSPNGRSSHKNSIPTMAGVSFFLALLFIVILIKPWDVNYVSINLVAAAGLMFAIGLKDDLVMSTPRAKIIGEILAIFFVLFCNRLDLSSLNGFLGIYDIPDLVSYIIVILMILIIINSYNLIDGIDGLAPSIGIVVFSFYAYLFYILSLNFYFLLSLSFVGMLLAYIRFNVSKTRKVFMGDTGSLVIGFCIGFVSLKFLSIDAEVLEVINIKAENSFIIISGILSIPLFDTFRVIGIRLINKKSIFYPDHNHVHHVLIDSGLTHIKASLFLFFLNIIIAITLLYLSSYFNSYQMVGILFSYFLTFVLAFNKLKLKVKKRVNFKNE